MTLSHSRYRRWVRAAFFSVPGLTLVMFLLAGCSPIIAVDRDNVSKNIVPILELEQRASLLTAGSQVLDGMGEISREDAGELKAHYDVYFVYYLAANVDLARGDMKSFRAHFELARRELDAIEALLERQEASFENSDGSIPERTPLNAARPGGSSI